MLLCNANSVDADSPNPLNGANPATAPTLFVLEPEVEGPGSYTKNRYSINLELRTGVRIQTNILNSFFVRHYCDMSGHLGHGELPGSIIWLDRGHVLDIVLLKPCGQ